MKDNRDKIVDQAKFCKDLMVRLEKSATENIKEGYSCYYVRNRYQIHNDIVRLRRELTTLNHMIYGED